MGRGGMSKENHRCNSCLWDKTPKPTFYAENPSEIGHNFCPVRSEKVSYKGERSKRHVLTCMTLLEPTSACIAPEMSPIHLICSKYLAIHLNSFGPTYFILIYLL